MCRLVAFRLAYGGGSLGLGGLVRYILVRGRLALVRNKYSRTGYYHMRWKMF